VVGEVPDRSRAALRVAETDAEIQRELAALMERIAPLTADWGGEAAASFRVLQRRWQAEAASLHAAMGELAGALEPTR
jgi:WXG100 family type VII secretion target